MSGALNRGKGVAVFMDWNWNLVVFRIHLHRILRAFAGGIQCPYVQGMWLDGIFWFCGSASPVAPNGWMLPGQVSAGAQQRTEIFGIRGKWPYSRTCCGACDWWGEVRARCAELYMLLEILCIQHWTRKLHSDYVCLSLSRKSLRDYREDAYPSITNKHLFQPHGFFSLLLR